MMYTNKFLGILMGIVLVATAQSASARMPAETASFFNGPTVSRVADTSATLSLSSSVLSGLTEEEKSRVYFEYGETYQMCIMIYPTPPECLPKKTEKGETSIAITGLKPNTSYTAKYKMDNTIMCITTPCPGNEFESAAVEFTTKASGAGTTPSGDMITINLRFGMTRPEVAVLQHKLIDQGYLTSTATGYFGKLTLRAVKDFQKNNGIPPTGFVGILTRTALNQHMTSSTGAEYFEGTITAYSTQCFVDGECSVTVDGKKVVTALGWHQETVGTVRGIPDFGQVAQKVGAHAKVYAKKTADGYTLYGSTDYYIEIQ
jgi:hypothetical protein